MPTIGAIDLFCGVGGLTHGLEQSGIKVRAGVDIDPTCRYPYEANNSASYIERDVAEMTSDDLGELFGDSEVRLLAGCAPCQPFSTYSRATSSAKRSEEWRLVEVFGQLVAASRPDFVTMENVPQLVDHPVFAEFLAHLRGYQVDWRVVHCHEIGIPQTRTRLVLVAARGTQICLPETLGTATRTVTVRDAISALPPIDAGCSHPSDRIHRSSRLSEVNLRRIRASRPGGTWRDWPSELRADCHRRASGETFPSVYGRMEWDEPSPTVTTQCFGYGNGRFGHPDQDRAISLREAAMLQTFPRDYAFVHEEDPVRFNRLGRLIGNAVPVLLGQAVGDVIVGATGTN